MALHVVLTEFI